MNKVKRTMAVLLSLLLFASVMTAAPAGAEEPDGGFDLPEIAEPALLDGSTPMEELVNEVLATNPELMKAPAAEAAETTVEGNDASVVVDLPDLDTQINYALRAEDVAAGETFTPSEFELVMKNAGKRLKQNQSGTAEVSNAATGSTSLVESTENGVRVLLSLRDKTSAREFKYQAFRDGEALKFMQTEDGVIYVGTGNKYDFSALGLVEAPWAFDAAGEKVRAEYKISPSGKTLTLAVKPKKNTVYPIVADPSLTFNAGEVHCSYGSCTFYLERVKTYEIRDKGSALGTTLFATFLGKNLCGYILAATSWSGMGSAIASNACVLAVAATAWRIKQQASYEWSCLTFKKKHWESPPEILRWDNISHASGSSDHCHYDV